jgi:hypothetical protein
MMRAGAGTLDGISGMTALTSLDLSSNRIAGMVAHSIDVMLLRCVSRATAWSICVRVVCEIEIELHICRINVQCCVNI